VKRVACLGDCCLDVYLEPVGRVLVGGSCLNVAVGLQQHGTNAAYAGPIGDDTGGARVLALLAKHGVGRDHVRSVPGARTAVTDILLEPDGERRFLHEDYAIQDAYAPSEADWEWVASTGAVHCSRMPAHLERLKRLGAESARVSYDFTTDAIPEHLHGIEIAFVPDEALDGRDPAGAARELVARGVACAVVTLGERGAIAATAEALERVAAVPVARVTDTCGAGDAFMAAFLGDYLSGEALRSCLASGAAAGAAACLHLGAIQQDGFALEGRA
jgi:fructoselysine 6-kinase